MRKRDGEKGLKRENDAKITVRTGVYLLEREREREREREVLSKASFYSTVKKRRRF